MISEKSANQQLNNIPKKNRKKKKKKASVHEIVKKFS